MINNPSGHGLNELLYIVAKDLNSQLRDLIPAYGPYRYEDIRAKLRKGIG